MNYKLRSQDVLKVQGGARGSTRGGRDPQALRVTPAVEAGITDHVWTLEEIVGLLP